MRNKAEYISSFGVSLYYIDTLPFKFENFNNVMKI